MAIETPLALWLFPAGVIALLLLQLWQARRRELLVGSLLVWRRVMKKERAKPRRRLVLDRSFWLQAATLLLVALAWSDPTWTGRSAPGRRFVVVVDNGSSARFRTADGVLLWDGVQASTQQFLLGLNEADRVKLCTAVPLSKVLPDDDGVPAGRAMQQLKSITPGLTPHAPAELWRLARNTARLWEERAAVEPGDVRALVFSAQAAPSEGSGHDGAHWVAVPPSAPVNNVGLTAHGATSPFEPSARELLVQVRNFGVTDVSGSVSCELRDGSAMAPQQLELPAGRAAGVVFSFAGAFQPCRIVWQNQHGPDALPEDDTLTIMPKTLGKLRTRWHGEAAHLQDLFRRALRAEELPIEAKEKADLEVFVQCLPVEQASGDRAILLLAPPKSYGSVEVLGETLKRPIARLGDPNRLTHGLKESETGLDWPIGEARAIRQLGDLRLLAQDAKGHVLAAAFHLEDQRPVYVFAFVPGEGLGWMPQRRFDSPGLAALLLRILREAAGANEPFAVQQAASIERTMNQPLPLDWVPTFGQEGSTGEGVLEAKVSGVSLAAEATAAADVTALAGTTSPRHYALWPLLVLCAIVLILVEVRSDQRPRTAIGNSGSVAEQRTAEVQHV